MAVATWRLPAVSYVTEHVNKSNYCRKMKCIFWCCAILAYLSLISTANGQQRKKDVRKAYTFYNNIFR
jgi:hypothetical protein